MLPRPARAGRRSERLDYYCVDVESSGPIPGMHNLLSVGCTHVRRFQGTYQSFESIYVELRPIFPEFDDAAMRVNKLDVARLESEGLSPEKAMSRLVEFVESNRHAKKERPVFVAHNAPFDWMFFTYYCGHAGVANPFGHSALDTKALAMGKLDLPWVETTLKNIAGHLEGIPELEPEERHHAGSDAHHLAGVFCALMNGRVRSTPPSSATPP